MILFLFLFLFCFYFYFYLDVKEWLKILHLGIKEVVVGILSMEEVETLGFLDNF